MTPTVKRVEFLVSTVLDTTPKSKIGEFFVATVLDVFFAGISEIAIISTCDDSMTVWEVSNVEKMTFVMVVRRHGGKLKGDMATGSSSNEEKMEDLDLVKYTHRAVGILQACQHMPTILNVEENIPVFLSKGDILVDVESSSGSGGSRQMISPSSLPKALFQWLIPSEPTRSSSHPYLRYLPQSYKRKIHGQATTTREQGLAPLFPGTRSNVLLTNGTHWPLKATLLTTDDTFRIGSSCNALDPLLPPDEGEKPFFEIRNLRGFMDIWTVNDKLHASLAQNRVLVSPQPILLSDEQNIEVYWGLTFLGKTGALVAGILASVPSLEEMGFKNWILPTGDKIPLSSLRPTIFEVVPINVYSVNQKVTRAVEGPATYFGAEPGDHPDPEFIRFDTRKVMTTMSDAGDKLTIRHAVLSAELPDGTVYIVDPTGRQFGYKGTNGSVVIHGILDEYKENFPGLVVAQHIDAPLEPSAADGFIPVLQRLLGKYLKKIFCAYCGELDEIHPEQLATTPINNGRDLFCSDKPSDLMYCAGCRRASYCTKLCQKLDWKNHKPTCK
ncbi:SET domain-containing protein 14 [Folsomia candida]|uniref:SET domain-containing protein 14 n=1 Tax=Folsomia candida TaxID=158441 RepID=A0A226EC88_FOLCA|nr:SET domain-containing protein 14 [Folsomia candida]